MSSHLDKSNISQICNYFHNKTVLLTGGTGFLGKLLVERLLRSGNVKEIILMSRPKRGQSTVERVENIFSGKCFEKLNALDPNYKNRIKIINSDMEKVNMDLKPNDETYIIKHAQVIIHAAATVNFTENIWRAVAINVRATRDMLRLADKVECLEIFLYISTAYSHCPQHHIEEKFYKAPIKPSEIIYLMENFNEKFKYDDGIDVISILKNVVIDEWPNSYTYTKAIAEEMVREYEQVLPLAILRPSIVTGAYEEPLVGWSDSFLGLNGVIIGGMSGLIHVAYAKMDYLVDIIPADFVVSSMMAICQDRSKKVDSVKIYNCVCTPSNPLTWNMCCNETIDTIFKSWPLKRSLGLPFAKPTGSRALYFIMAIFLHIIPATIIDSLLVLAGKKPQLMLAYKRITSFSDITNYFVVNEWTFSDTNTKELSNSLTEIDRKLFSFDISKVEWNQYLINFAIGMRRYFFKEPDCTRFDASARNDLWKRIIKLFLVVLVSFSLWFVGKTYLADFFEENRKFIPIKFNC